MKFLIQINQFLLDIIMGLYYERYQFPGGRGKEKMRIEARTNLPIERRVP
jgi:hypothetical protein